jgi:hypothetical protein
MSAFSIPKLFRRRSLMHRNERFGRGRRPRGALMNAASEARGGVKVQAKALIMKAGEGLRTEASMGAVMAGAKTTAA